MRSYCFYCSVWRKKNPKIIHITVEIPVRSLFVCVRKQTITLFINYSIQPLLVPWLHVLPIPCKFQLHFNTYSNVLNIRINSPGIIKLKSLERIWTHLIALRCSIELNRYCEMIYSTIAIYAKHALTRSLLLTVWTNSRRHCVRELNTYTLLRI